MKKLAVILFFMAFSMATFAQGLFKTVPFFPNASEQKKLIREGETPISQKWAVRFDATFQLNEAVYHKDTKKWDSQVAVGVGPAIGFQHFIPTSELDPTPFNNYGASAGVILGDNLKMVLQANIWEYFKFGVAFTPKPLLDLGKFGFFIGTGITF